MPRLMWERTEGSLERSAIPRGVHALLSSSSTQNCSVLTGKSQFQDPGKKERGRDHWKGRNSLLEKSLLSTCIGFVAVTHPLGQPHGLNL